MFGDNRQFGFLNTTPLVRRIAAGTMIKGILSVVASPHLLYDLQLARPLLIARQRKKRALGEISHKSLQVLVKRCVPYTERIAARERGTETPCRNTCVVL